LRGMGWVSRTEYQRYRFEQHANAFLNNVHEQNISIPTAIKRTDDDEVGELANVVEGLVTIYVTALDAMEGFQIKDDRAPAIDESLEIQQARELVSKALEKLGGQERQLLELYYYRELSLEEVGKHLGLSKSWTSRLHTRAVQKMGRLLKDLVDEYSEDRRALPDKKRSSTRQTQPSGPSSR
ncbi:MAG: sigma-70 family RNA polymerase sigma factor, partial [Myxococcota bacterium]